MIKEETKMNTIKKLKALESELGESHAYEEKKAEAASIVQNYFQENKGKVPSDSDIEEYFLSKYYLHIDTELPKYHKIETNTICELEESFYELINRAVYLKFKMQTNEANSYFSDANIISNSLDNTFINAHYEFARSLEGDNLKMKLKTDNCYELVNRTLENNKNEGISLIGSGLSLAEQLNDEKRKFDFLSKCHYVLYEIENYPNVAMSLGKYLVFKVNNYDTIQGWTHFHNGNIWIDFKNPISAKEEFELAFELAHKTKSHYAIMVLSERLALVYRRLQILNLAEHYYEESLRIGETEDIKPILVLKNRVRCLIGMGNIQLDLARKQSGAEKERKCNKAEIKYKQALEIANQVNYTANKAIALSCLGSLYRTRFDDTNPDAKRFHKLAYKINVNELKLDETSERIKKDKSHI